MIHTQSTSSPPLQCDQVCALPKKNILENLKPVLNMKFPNPFPFQSFKSQVTQLLLSTGQGEEAQLHLLRQHGRFQPPPLLQGEAPGSTLKMLKGKPLGGLRLGKSQ